MWAGGSARQLSSHGTELAMSRSGHWVPEENPTEFVDAVEEFLIVGGSAKASA